MQKQHSITKEIAYSAQSDDELCMSTVPHIPDRASSPERIAHGWTLHQEQGRRVLTLRIDSMHFKVREIPAEKITSQEWKVIAAARESFATMWGEEENNSDPLHKDDFDSSDLQQGLYRVCHYIAEVEEAGEPTKIVTGRLITYPLQSLKESNANALTAVGKRLPDDIGNWLIVDQALNHSWTLWEELQKRIQTGQLSGFSVISRAATFPYGEMKKDERQREKTAIAFAAMYLLAASAEAGELIFCQQCIAFPQKVLSLQTVQGDRALVAFERTEETLEMGPTRKLFLDNTNPKVVEYKTHFPGYWLNNQGAAEVMMMRSQNCTEQELKQIWENIEAVLTNATNNLAKQKLMAGLQGIGLQWPLDLDVVLAENERLRSLLGLLTSPCSFQFCVPLLQERKQLGSALVDQAGDGPYSGCLEREQWLNRAAALLRHAQEKYS